MDIAVSTHDAINPLVEWLDYLEASEKTSTADEFLTGLRASLMESLGCLAAGLVRPAIFSMRSQIDISLGWLYFRDHPVEWRRVARTGDGFKLKGDAMAYLDENIPNFKSRFAVLTKTKKRTEEDPYRLLSAYVHGQSPATLPKYGGLSDLVWTSKLCEDGVKLQFEVGEYVSDIFVAYFAGKWASLPANRVAAVQARAGQEASKVFS
ncbi:MAG: hypothetical protein KL863_26885 [Rhizobium sp.]|nr:hypothetical protein [Rhizobium sp.]